MTNTGIKITQSSFCKSITTKFESMRKEDTFVVYPLRGDNYYIQGDRVCAYINKDTGHGKWTNKGTTPMDYYLAVKTAKPFTASKELLQAVREVATIA